MLPENPYAAPQTVQQQQPDMQLSMTHDQRHTLQSLSEGLQLYMASTTIFLLFPLAVLCTRMIMKTLPLLGVTGLLVVVVLLQIMLVMGLIACCRGVSSRQCQQLLGAALLFKSVTLLGLSFLGCLNLSLWTSVELIRIVYGILFVAIVGIVLEMGVWSRIAVSVGSRSAGGNAHSLQYTLAVMGLVVLLRLISNEGFLPIISQLVHNREILLSYLLMLAAFLCYGLFLMVMLTLQARIKTLLLPPRPSAKSMDFLRHEQLETQTDQVLPQAERADDESLPCIKI
ncbi:MAG: hypothetical protein SFX18_07680 [Pirellulales bacterium]|nr:hypothetical protein [Pirellulales bacterium]